jgi:CMP-N-acetylneuraminic acid synthetase
VSVSAIVVARGGSVRLPGKALLPFGDSTLIGHKVRQLLACWTVKRVFVNTDSHAIRDAAMEEGAEVIDGRDYGGDTHEMIRDSCEQAAGNVILWAHPTNPLVSPATYDAAVRAYWQGLEQGYDSLLSVYRVQRHAWFVDRPLNYDPWKVPHPLAAETRPVFFQDGAVFIQSRQQFIDFRYFFGDKPKLFETPPAEVNDIDYPEDIILARQKWEQIGYNESAAAVLETPRGVAQT